jgi:hypothetical protein
VRKPIRNQGLEGWLPSAKEARRQPFRQFTDSGKKKKDSTSDSHHAKDEAHAVEYACEARKSDGLSIIVIFLLFHQFLPPKNS